MKVHKWEDIRRRRLSDDELDEVDIEVVRELVSMNLVTLREELGLGETELVDAAAMTQSELSKLERRDDHLVSTLRRAVRALGGELEVTAVIKGRRVKLVV